MQAVLLAAGPGILLRPITYHVPKPMIKVAGKNLIEHNLDQLPSEIDEVILVIGHLAPQITNHFGNNYNGRKITYVEQKKLLGTGHAISLCKEKLNEKFLVMMGDDLYDKKDIEKCIAHERCILAKEVNSKFKGGRILLDTDNHLQNIIEGIHNNKSTSLANTGLYVLTHKFFDYDLVPLENGKGYGLPQTLVNVAKENPIKIEKADFWIQINDLPSLKRIENILQNRS